MSDTPRTDKHKEQMEIEDLDVECSETYHLARDLERELNAAKSGNLPDPLAEAVKRMEAVPEMELERVWSNAHRTRLLPCIEAVRARLISAAKGEQP